MTPKDSAAMSSLTEKLRAANEAKALRRDGEEKVGHTPGPWAVIKHNHVDGDLWLSVNAGQEGEMRPWIAEVKYLTAPEAEQWANARLIAAAPELLEALRLARMYVVADGLPDDIEAVDAAIAKATGR